MNPNAFDVAKWIALIALMGVSASQICKSIDRNTAALYSANKAVLSTATAIYNASTNPDGSLVHIIESISSTEEGQPVEPVKPYDRKEAPVFDQFRTSTGRAWVSFNDNYAPGMKAYLVDDMVRIELTDKFAAMPTSQAFYLPKGTLHQDREFSVHARDRDGNKSEDKKIFVVDGVLVDFKPEL